MRLIEYRDEQVRFVPEAEDCCICCGHCMAICPTGAVTVEGLPETQFDALPKETIGIEALLDLMKTRRSVRAFRDEPVPRAMVDCILEAVAQAPLGFPAELGGVSIVNGKEKVARLLPPMVAFYRRLHRGMRSPFMRPILRLSMGKKVFCAIQNFMPVMDRMFAHYERTEEDVFTWSAPLLLVFHAPADKISAHDDPVIAATYAMLAAQALGLGTTIIGMVPPFVQQSRWARRFLSIPNGNLAQSALIAGFPRTLFTRSIARPPETQHL